MKNQFCNVKIGNEIQTINALIKEGQKQIKFEDLKDFCIYKKNISFLQKKFKKVGFVPSFYVKDDMFYVIKVITYIFKGKVHESIACLPIVRAFGKFKKYELN